MKALLEIGAFLLEWWWVLAILLGIAAVFGFFRMGFAFLDVLKEILKLLQTPLGQVALLIAALWLAMSAGYDRRASECATEMREFKASLERAAAAETGRQTKAAEVITSEDTLQAAIDAIGTSKDQEAIDAAPAKAGCGLSRDSARRVRDVGR